MPSETPNGAHDPSANGFHPSPEQAAIERAYLRVQCEKLRGWCLGLLDASPAVATLPQEVIRELRDNPPARTGGQILAELITFAGRVPPDGPYGPEAADLAGERERLKQLFFTLHDAIEPWTPMTDDEVKRMTTGVIWMAADDVEAGTRS